MQKATSIVSSRRGRNFLLHNLEESDVVFGTKGNGRNEMFLKVLESHSEQYMQLSKFQKMGLIQKIIRDWKGNFYIMNAKTNQLSLAKKKDHDLSTTDPSSRKLYTSVRRMMNYVNSKAQRQSYPPHGNENVGAPSFGVTPRRLSTPAGTLIPASCLSGTNSREHPPLVFPQGRKKIPAAVTTSTDYIRKNQQHATLVVPLPATPFLDSMNISSPKRSVMLVTPEPSPRAMLQDTPTFSPVPFAKPVLAQRNRKLAVAPLSLTPSVSSPAAAPQFLEAPTTSTSSSSAATIVRKKKEAKNSFSTQQQAIATTTLKARNKKIKKHLHSVTDNTIGDLEESAILALTALGCSNMLPAASSPRTSMFK